MKSAEFRLEDHLEKLRAFGVVAETASIRQAAERLGRTQPALTASLRILEDAIGARLFLRSSKGVSLTPQGRMLLEFARKLSRDAEALGLKLKTAENELSGFVRIGTFESLATRMWPRFVRDFTARHSRVRIQIRCGSSAGLQAALLGHEIDLAVCIEPEIHPELKITRLFSDHFGFFAASGYRRDRISRAELEAVPLVLVREAESGRALTLQQALWSEGLSHPLTYEMDSFTAVAAFAAEGVGIALLPCRVAEPEVRAGRIKPVSVEGMARARLGEHHFGAVFRREDRGEPVLRELLESLAGASRSEPHRG
jgi:DNA-binding transcriptional LysR family regulator